MEKEESTTCKLTGNAESRKVRWGVVDGDEGRQKLVATERQRLGEIVGHVADAGNMPKTGATRSERLQKRTWWWWDGWMDAIGF